MEITRTREQLAELAENLPPVSHIPGEINPADLGTRGQVTIGDLGPGSTWQTGPDFLTTDYERWPRTPEDEDQDMEVPAKECKGSHGISLHIKAEVTSNPVQLLRGEVGSESQLGQVTTKMGQVVLQREKLEMATRALARALQAVVTGSREACRRPPATKMIEVAVLLLLRSASGSAIRALKEGKLRGLGAEQADGIVWIQGRVRGEQLATLLGTAALPVILPSEPLARAVLSKAHREDHRRGPRDAAARSRRLVWVVAATRLAKSIIHGCFCCRHRDKRMERQQMGLLPPERLEMISPFEATALDLFGPFWVKDAANGRRRFKTWVVAYICMGAKAVCLLPCPGYSTEVFLTTHRFFTGIFGQPKVIYTDHAPSLVKAAETPDWGDIGSRIGQQGTEWRLTAKGCSWRNGLAERIIRSARHSLAQELVAGETLDFHQFGSVLAVVAAILNSRPLSLKISPEGDYHALSPRDVLFGRAGRSMQATDRALGFAMDKEQDVALRDMGNYQARIVDAWRKRWMESVFPDMVARPKWRSAYRNLRVGDVGHVITRVRSDRMIGDWQWWRKQKRTTTMW